MRFSPRSLWLAAPALTALSLLSSCTEKPKATDPDKTATVVSDNTMTASDSTAVTADSAAK